MPETKESRVPSGSMAVRLIAIDLDGTLLMRSGFPHPENVAAIAEARAAGIYVVLASGRVQTSVRYYAKLVGIEQPMVCCNGADAVWTDGREILHRRLDPGCVREIIDTARQDGIHASIYTRDRVIFLQEGAWAERYRERVKHVEPESLLPENLDDLDVSKVLLMTEASRVAGLRELFAAKLDQSLVHTTESEPEYLEFLPKGADKGSALAVVAESLGIQQAECAAIGDYLNDLEMVRWAGIGGAMENAHPTLKEAADAVWGHHENAGVAEFIRAIM